MNNNIDEIALSVLKDILKEAQDVWKSPDNKYKDYRTLQIDKRGSFGERVFHQVLSQIYFRKIKLEYNDGDQGDWDLKFNDKKFEIKTSSLDVNNKFQNEGLKRDGDYDGVLFLGVAPNDIYFRCLRKTDFNFDTLVVTSFEGQELTHLHDRGKDKSNQRATGAGYKCDFKKDNMLLFSSLEEFKTEFEKYFDPKTIKKRV